MNQAEETRAGKHRKPALSICFSVCVEDRAIDLAQLKSAVEAICHDTGVDAGEISVAIVDDAEMQKLHLQFLGVDETTDVMSFPLECEDDRIVAEIVVCHDVAVESARELKTSAAQELMLYVIHGMLHLVGYNDTTQAEFEMMRSAEIKYMGQFGFSVQGRDHSAHPEEGPS